MTKAKIGRLAAERTASSGTLAASKSAKITPYTTKEELVVIHLAREI